jgi:hypothetical protein
MPASVTLVNEVELLQSATAMQAARVRYLLATAEAEHFERVNELKTTDAGIRHVAAPEVELLQGATALQAAHVSWLLAIAAFVQRQGRKYRVVLTKEL